MITETLGHLTQVEMGINKSNYFFFKLLLNRLNQEILSN